ncbi:Protein white [Portunus trituberculatus]|uniref:Protein white n=1 Tax=Portunus trituberculatus TaxID=210409 RepID=A0A5B7GBT4_PORTR|nr:Protein white [Portunus trituberculatus]
MVQRNHACFGVQGVSKRAGSNPVPSSVGWASSLGARVSYWAERYDSLVDVEVKKSPYKASWWCQFRTVLWRSWLEVIREPMLIKVRFFQVMVSGPVSVSVFFSLTAGGCCLFTHFLSL